MEARVCLTGRPRLDVLSSSSLFKRVRNHTRWLQPWLVFSRQLFEVAHCGNGFVEAGEECDCGLRAVSSSSCRCPFTVLLIQRGETWLFCFFRTATKNAARNAPSPTGRTAATGLAATTHAWYDLGFKVGYDVSNFLTTLKGFSLFASSTLEVTAAASL